MTTEPFGYPELREILVERVGLPEDLVSEDASISFDALGLDSLARVEVLLAVQQRYDLDVPDADAVHFSTLGDAIAYVNARLGESKVA